MPIDADRLIERRRLRRRLRLWQVAAVIAAVLAVVAAVGRFDPAGWRDHVARLAVDGIIVDDSDRDHVLSSVAADGSVRALIVTIDSPGGTVVGGESLYRRLREVAAHKPVVAVMGEMATSAAYMTAIGADHIIAHDGSLTGSIGVILQTANLTGLLDKLGIKPETVKSSPLKAQPNPLEAFTPEARQATREVVVDVYEMFLAMVQERRKMSRDHAVAVSDGRVFTGRQALALGLVDALGDEQDAREWLFSAHGIDRSLPVREVDVAGTERSVRRLISSLSGKALFLETLSLDGLISMWHPAW